MELSFEYASDDDINFLTDNAKHVLPETWRRKVASREVILAKDRGKIVGWLSYTLLYDILPFINALVVLEDHRRQGIGAQLVLFFEREMVLQGADKLMTSSLAHETGQHFWRKLGFRDVGGILLSDEPLEIFFRKDFVRE